MHRTIRTQSEVCVGRIPMVECVGGGRNAGYRLCAFGTLRKQPKGVNYQAEPSLSRIDIGPASSLSRFDRVDMSSILILHPQPEPVHCGALGTSVF